MRCLLFVLLMLIASRGVPAACVVTARTEVPLEVTGGTIFVEVMINGRPARMVLDTGAQRSVVTRAAVARLDLALDEWVATTMRGVGGLERNRNALPRSLALGGIALVRRTLTHDTSLTVATLPNDTRAGRAIDGLLGRDFLAPFDLSLELPARTLTLYSVEACQGAFLPWPQPYSALPVQNPMDTALSVQVEIDGIPLRALLDTGASTTLIAAPGMARLGLTAETMAQAPSRAMAGLGPRTIATQSRQFRTMRIGGEVCKTACKPFQIPGVNSAQKFPPWSMR